MNLTAFWNLLSLIDFSTILNLQSVFDSSIKWCFESKLIGHALIQFITSDSGRVRVKDLNINEFIERIDDAWNTDNNYKLNSIILILKNDLIDPVFVKNAFLNYLKNLQNVLDADGRGYWRGYNDITKAFLEYGKLDLECIKKGLDMCSNNSIKELLNYHIRCLPLFLLVLT